MEKPKIEIVGGYAPSLKKMNHVFINGNRLCICEKDNQSDSIRSMIDALIDLVKVCPIEKQYQIDAFEKGKKALKKAGCHD